MREKVLAPELVAARRRGAGECGLVDTARDVLTGDLGSVENGTDVTEAAKGSREALLSFLDGSGEESPARATPWT
ncbi:hypothetical protein [Azospirillum sp. TSO22-1]|uniref:hypothetical protein n=1 Tax=Azospirillum sp. TSO22-1 TaxID=716789 RepID=UPI0011B79531|nr:hypothetical protein [Azospirillum sp. TSO22-1]